MSYSRAEEVSAGAAQLAAERGLVCFDPSWAAFDLPQTAIRVTN